MRKLQLLILILLYSSITLAQERIISGTVLDASGGGLPGVNVIVKGTSTGTVTDISRKYSFEIAQNAQNYNYQTINKITFPEPIETAALKIEIEHPSAEIPAALIHVQFI